MENLLNTSKYRIMHSVEEPSRLLDYDYDPSNPSRRFVSTYIHKLKFLDPIMDTEIASISFSSEVAIKMIAGITNMMYMEKNRPLMYTLKGIYIEGDYIPIMSTILRNREDGVILTLLVRNSEPIRLEFSFYEAELFIENLQDDQQVNTCMSYSDQC